MRLVAPALAVLALLAPPPAPAQPFPPGDHPTLTVRGSGLVERRPDHAEMSVTVMSRGATPEAAIEAHRARIAQATAVLARFKADGVTVDDGSFSLSRQRSSQAPTAGTIPVSFEAETRYRLAFPSLDRFDATATAIVSSGLFEFDTAHFSSSGGDAALDEARRAAVQDARRQADLYADAAGLRLDGIDRIAAPDADDRDGFPVQGRIELRGAAMPGGSVGIVPPKTIPFGASVTVTWRVAPR